MSDLDDLEEITDLFEMRSLRPITPKLAKGGRRLYQRVMENGNTKQNCPGGRLRNSARLRKVKITLAEHA